MTVCMYVLKWFEKWKICVRAAIRILRKTQNLPLPQNSAFKAICDVALFSSFAICIK